jgi:uncharacterized protein YukE
MSKAADRIALDADAVALTAKRLGSHADDTRTNHLSTHGSLSTALYGCVGSSGEELANLSQRWATVGTRHSERLDGLSRHVGEAGARLVDTDDTSADRIGRVAEQVRDQ